MSVFTGEVKGAGTDANVFLTVFGDRGDSGERKLAKSETHRDKFEKGQVGREARRRGVTSPASATQATGLKDLLILKMTYLGPVRLGPVRLGPVRLDPVHLGPV